MVMPAISRPLASVSAVTFRHSGSARNSAQFFFEALNCARQARLRHAASTRGFREVQRFSQIEEVSDLIDIHV